MGQQFDHHPLCETSEEDRVHLITQVRTTLATESDMHALEKIHRPWEQKELLPAEHLLDSRSTTLGLLLSIALSFVEQARLYHPLPAVNPMGYVSFVKWSPFK